MTHARARLCVPDAAIRMMAMNELQFVAAHGGLTDARGRMHCRARGYRQTNGRRMIGEAEGRSDT